MPFLEWNPQCSIGVESLDVEHARLVATANAFYDALLSGASVFVLHEAVAQLARQTKEHFVHEEESMRRSFYPDCDGHSDEHRRLLEALMEFDAMLTFDDMERCDQADVVASFLHGWLMEHILVEDEKLGAYLVHAEKVG